MRLLTGSNLSTELKTVKDVIYSRSTKCAYWSVDTWRDANKCELFHVSCFYLFLLNLATCSFSPAALTFVLLESRLEEDIFLHSVFL